MRFTSLRLFLQARADRVLCLTDRENQHQNARRLQSRQVAKRDSQGEAIVEQCCHGTGTQGTARQGMRTIPGQPVSPSQGRMIVHRLITVRRDWCRDRGIPWRKGYLFEGVPGSGKTSLIHALASHLDMDVCFVSLATSG